MSFREDYQSVLSASAAKVKFFGIGLGVLLGVFSAAGFWRHAPTAFYFGTAAVACLVLAFFKQVFLIPVYRAWMAAAYAVGFVMSLILMGVVFLAVLTPIGIVLRLLGKDLLDKRYPDAKASHWRSRQTAEDTRKRATLQY